MDNIHFIAEGIRKLRKEKRLSQEKLAELAGISQNHLSKVESGCRTIGMKTYLKLLDALGAYPIFVKKTERKREEELVNYFVQTIKDCPEKEIGFFPGYYCCT